MRVRYTEFYNVPSERSLWQILKQFLYLNKIFRSFGINNLLLYCRNPSSSWCNHRDINPTLCFLNLYKKQSLYWQKLYIFLHNILYEGYIGSLTHIKQFCASHFYCLRYEVYNIVCGAPQAPVICYNMNVVQDLRSVTIQYLCPVLSW